MMGRHVMLAWYICVALRFSTRSGPVLLKNYIFVISQGGPEPLRPSGSAND